MLEQEQKIQREASPKTDILHLLRPVGIMEARYVRMLSNLCSLTYSMESLTSQSLLRRHQLQLVTTSVACDRGLREAAQAARIGVTMTTDADAMAADAYTIATTYGRLLAGQTPDEAATSSTEALTTVSKVQTITTDTIKKQTKGPAEVVANSLNAAVAAATAAAGSIYSAAAPYASPVANNITSFTLSVTGFIPARTIASQLQAAASAGHSTAVATVATVAAAITSAQRSNTTTSTTDSITKDPQSPVAWIVADEPSSATRYFILQGSDNLDHWRVNLTFDPVVFEGPSLGITVHRGVYEAALLLYNRFLPLVEDHIASASASATTQPLVAFTGHSLGGSLGTLLMMMYVHRGVIPLSAVSPTYTFGAPAVLCDMKMNRSEYDPSKQQQQQQQQHDYLGAVLARLGLPTSSVINIMMHNDIVPRAFACDYQLVSDLLKRVGGGFRNQASLLVAERQQLFTPIGQMYVLQPDEGLKFVKKEEGYHPLLPAGPGLFALRMPPHMGMSGNNNSDSVQSHIVEEEEHQVLAAALAVSNLVAPSAADVLKKMNVTGSYDGMIDGVSTYHRQQQENSSSSTSIKKSSSVPSFSPSNSQLVPVALATTNKTCKKAESVSEAIWELMNSPHPLDTLSESGAYGANGSISRYHNPDHYTKALGSVLKSRGEEGWTIVRRAAENVGMRYYVPRIKSLE